MFSNGWNLCWTWLERTGLDDTIIVNWLDVNDQPQRSVLSFVWGETLSQRDRTRGGMFTALDSVLPDDDTLDEIAYDLQHWDNGKLLYYHHGV